MNGSIRIICVYIFEFISEIKIKWPQVIQVVVSKVNKKQMNGCYSLNVWLSAIMKNESRRHAVCVWEVWLSDLPDWVWHRKPCRQLHRCPRQSFFAAWSDYRTNLAPLRAVSALFNWPRCLFWIVWDRHWAPGRHKLPIFLLIRGRSWVIGWRLVAETASVRDAENSAGWCWLCVRFD